MVRYYLQEKEDPHGANVAVFVGNLPPGKAQRLYERILLRLLGAEGKSLKYILFEVSRTAHARTDAKLCRCLEYG